MQGFFFKLGKEDTLKGTLSKLLGGCSGEPRIMKDPALQIAVVKIADSRVNGVARPWVNSSADWGVYMAVHEAMKKAFDAEGINISYPQRDVHVYQHPFHSLRSSN